MSERKLPILGVIREMMTKRGARQRLRAMARERGVRIFEEHLAADCSSQELSDRIFEAAEGELDGLSGEVWIGYFQRREKAINAQDRDRRE